MNRSRLLGFPVIYLSVFYILLLHAGTGWCQSSGSSAIGEVLTLERAVMLALTKTIGR
jgi:hypothetical protein